MQKKIYLSCFLILMLSCGFLGDRRNTRPETPSPVETIMAINGNATLTVEIPALETALPPTITPPATPAVMRPKTGSVWPDTSRGIHVFNDQLSTQLSEAQVEFAATHYAGTQKMTRGDVGRLRKYNPNFLVLNYRLGLGLGYRRIGANCQADGDWLAIIEGDEWVQEYPKEESLAEEVFYHYPEDNGQRVKNCDWGWYLMDPDSSAWRVYWLGEVNRQVTSTGANGVFIDSLSVPNYLGGDRYQPNLPDVDPTFEQEWANKIDNWLAWLEGETTGKYDIIVNVGSWITTRDPTRYVDLDGIMVEGFAIEADASPYASSDWQLQMNRVLGVTRQGKVILGQTYVYGLQERMFTLGSYLLVRGEHTFINIEQSEEPEWFPEYEIPIGKAIDSAGDDIVDLFDESLGVYRRRFDDGLVLVNPANPYDDGAESVTINLDHEYRLAQVQRGGIVDENGNTSGALDYVTVSQVTLVPYSAAVLLEP